jgi:PhnB protein
MKKAVKAVKRVVTRVVKKAAPRKKARKVSAVPRGYHTVTPYLVVRGAASAMAFYTKAFGAKEKMRMAAPDGTVMHAELRIGDSIIMLGDEMPEMGATAPPTVGGTAVQVFLYVKNVDEWFARATSAGATVTMPPTDMFWGDRYAKLIDPFGHQWSLATHVEDASPKEMGRRFAAEMSQ